MRFFPMLNDDAFDGFHTLDASNNTLSGTSRSTTRTRNFNAASVGDLAKRLSLQTLHTVMLSTCMLTLAFLALYHLSDLQHHSVMLLAVVISWAILISYGLVVQRQWLHRKQENISSKDRHKHQAASIQTFIVLCISLAVGNALIYFQQSAEPTLSFGLLLILVVISGLLITKTRHLLLLTVTTWCFWISLVTYLAMPQSNIIIMAVLLVIATIISLVSHQFNINLRTQLNTALHNATRSHNSLEKMLERARKGEEQYRLLADSTSDGVVIYDQGTIISANTRCGEIFGYHVEELREKDWIELIAPRARDVIQAHIERGAQDFSQAQIQIVPNNGENSSIIKKNRYESFGLHSKGRVFPLEISERLLPLEDRYITIATVRDTTRDKETEGRMRSYEEELEQRNAELLRANKLKTSFLANMSHELRTPLTAINGFAELLRSEYFGSLNPKQTQYVVDIHESGKHLLELINGILDLSKVEADKMTLHLQHTDLGALAHEALKIVQAQAAAKAITLEVDSESESVVLVDPVRIKQVLYNYLSNAVKFTPQGGDVRVHIYNTDHAIITEVRDTGIGISEEDQGKLFEPFVQLDNTTTRNQDGTGLGLALSRQLIHMHGGEVWVQSVIDEGSTFSFSLPLSLSVLGSGKAKTLASDTATASPLVNEEAS